MSGTSPVLFAHQGGWDEVLLIAGPIIVIMALLWLAKRRVDHAASLAGKHADPTPSPDAD